MKGSNLFLCLIIYRVWQKWPKFIDHGVDKVLRRHLFNKSKLSEHIVDGVSGSLLLYCIVFFAQTHRQTLPHRHAHAHILHRERIFPSKLFLEGFFFFFFDGKLYMHLVGLEPWDLTHHPIIIGEGSPSWATINYNCFLKFWNF